MGPKVAPSSAIIMLALLFITALPLAFSASIDYSTGSGFGDYNTGSGFDYNSLSGFGSGPGLMTTILDLDLITTILDLDLTTTLDPDLITTILDPDLIITILDLDLTTTLDLDSTTTLDLE